jgi:SRSO17 transposase
MTTQDFQAIGTGFQKYIKSFLDCCPHPNTQANLTTYCEGLLSKLERKSVEPIALAGGPAVRTLQAFLTDRIWDENHLRCTLQQRLAATLKALPKDDLGTIGVIDETSCRKWGDKTPGVQRQYLGCVGKVDNGIVTVHIGVAQGTFATLADADLYLPKSWADDRDRCREAGIPDHVVYRSKWRIAFDQWMRMTQAGHKFNWLIFDEGYGSKVPFLRLLAMVSQRYVGEVPKSFALKSSKYSVSRPIRTLLRAASLARGIRVHITHRTVADTVWKVAERHMIMADQPVRAIAAVCESTGEQKFFVSNDLTTPLVTLVRVAFRRWTIEHSFRLAKQEVGLMDFEGRQYRGLIRHLTLCCVVLGYVSQATESLRKKKSGGDRGAGVSGVERVLCEASAASVGSFVGSASLDCDSVSSAA